MIESTNSLRIKTISPNNSLKININKTPIIKLSFDNFVINDTPIWSEDFEEYNIMPSADEDLILSTNNKKMVNNIIIHKIPYNNMTGKNGGNIIIIGE